MPVIARFYGIVVKMYFSDHLPPHFHAIYGEYNGVFDLNTMELIEGDLPGRAVKLVREWQQMYKGDLIGMWETKEFKKLPGLE